MKKMRPVRRGRILAVIVSLILFAAALLCTPIVPQRTAVAAAIPAHSSTFLVEVEQKIRSLALYNASYLGDGELKLTEVKSEASDGARTLDVTGQWNSGKPAGTPEAGTFQVTVTEFIPLLLARRQTVQQTELRFTSQLDQLAYCASTDDVTFRCSKELKNVEIRTWADYGGIQFAGFALFYALMEALTIIGILRLFRRKERFPDEKTPLSAQLVLLLAEWPLLWAFPFGLAHRGILAALVITALLLAAGQIILRRRWPRGRMETE